MWICLRVLLLLRLMVAVVGKLHREGDPIAIGVKPLTPGGGSHDESLYLYPVDYYNSTLGSCGPMPQGPAKSRPGTLLSEDIYFGNNLKAAPFNTTFLQKQKCQRSCNRVYRESNVSLINDLILRNYKLNFFIEDIPVGRESYDFETGQFYVESGVPMGYIDTDKIPHLFNHFQFVVYYKAVGLDFELLYATVAAQSLSRISQVPLSCVLHQPLFLARSDYVFNGNIVTYDVVWRELNRFAGKNIDDIYRNDIVRPFVVQSSLFSFLVLACVVGGYAYSTINRALTSEKSIVLTKVEIDASNMVDEIDEYDLSWPALASDVFRAPSFAPLLFWLVAVGFQLAVCALILAAGYTSGHLKLHLMNNQFAAAFHHLGLATLPVYSLVYAYFTKKFPKTLKHLALSVILNSLALPAIIYHWVVRYNSLHASVGSPYKVPLELFHRIALQYAAITFASFLIGYKFLKPKVQHVNEIEREVPDQPLAFRLVPNMAITGLIPFGVTLVPLSSLYITLWYNHTYADPTVTVASLILVVLITSISVLNVFYSLSIGNWRWLWFAFLSGASVGIYTFAYSFKLTNWSFGDSVSLQLFLLQDIVISSILAAAGGAVSVCASLVFVTLLYAGV